MCVCVCVCVWVGGGGREGRGDEKFNTGKCKLIHFLFLKLINSLFFEHNCRNIDRVGFEIWHF